MGNQPYEVNPAGRERTGGNRPPTIANLPAVPTPVAGAPRPATSSHQCPNCGAWTPIGSSICAECGVRMQPKPQKVRCRLCGVNAPASLVICPHCGRELQAAPSRVLSWGAPTVLVLLALLILGPRLQSDNSLGWLQSGFGAGRAWVDEMAQRLDPQITVSTLPATVGEGQVIDNVTALQPDPQVNTLSNSDAGSTNEQPPVVVTSGSAGVDAQSAPADNGQLAPPVESAIVTPTTTLVEPTATAPLSVQPTATTAAPEPTATATPVATIAATPVPPTPTSAPSATPRQPATSAIVNALPVVTTPDNTVITAGAATNNDEAAKTILQPTPTLPLPTPTPVPPTATPVPAALTYVVKAGDTPGAIAEQFGITVNELLAANGLSLNDARRLRVGQSLTIGAVATPAPTATNTPTTASATATPTLPAAPTATNTPVSTIRVDAPVLRSPENGSSLSCSGANSLIWLPVTYIRESDQYLLHLGFLSGYNGDGVEQVTWVLEQWRPSNVTLWDLDSGLCSLAPQAYGREWRWYVEVVEAAGGGWQPVSPPSTIGRFSWN